MKNPFVNTDEKYFIYQSNEKHFISFSDEVFIDSHQIPPRFVFVSGEKRIEISASVAQTLIMKIPKKDLLNLISKALFDCEIK